MLMIIVQTLFSIGIVYLPSSEITYFHGYAVVGFPYMAGDEYEHNGRVLGRILDTSGRDVLGKIFVLEDLSDIEECEDIILVIDDSQEQLVFGYFDRQSGFFCKPQFEEISLYTSNNETLVGVKSRGLWGFCNRFTGNIEITCKYDAIAYDFRNGYAIVILYDKQSDKYSERHILINQLGDEIVFPDDIRPMSLPDEEGVLIIADYSSHNCLYGIANVNGETLLRPCFENQSDIIEYRRLAPH